MEAKEYLKLATENTDAGNLIKENNLTETIIKMLDNYVEIRLKKLSEPAFVISEERAELCKNPNCEDGIVDYDYYGNKIYCDFCDKHN